MTKTDIVDYIVNNTTLSRSQAINATDSVIEAISHSLIKGESVFIRGFATDCCQCEDRAHRIGQKDNVTCYYLLGRGTIDHTIYRLIHRKKSIANEIMNADDEIPTDEMYFNELVKSFLNTSG